MKIIILTRHNPSDIYDWSGTTYHIYNKLKEKHTVEIIGTEILKQFGFFQRGNFSTNTFVPIDMYVKKLGRLLSEQICRLNCDLIFFGDLLLIPSDINIPVVLLSDMNYEQVKLHFIKTSDKRIIESGINLEKLSFENAYKIIYSSEWIKNKTIEAYNIDPNKIEVVEFGANIPTPTNYSIEINTDICRLVFIGKKWEKKGGDKVLQAYKQLKQEGFPCTLAIIGSCPKGEQDEDENLTVIPHLDKAKPEDLKKLCDILSESHFLVLPTQFDAFGIVFCEASAFGVPSIAADVGGVSQAVKEGKNGYLLPADATSTDYAEKIKAVFNDKENYIKLRQSSRHEFETRLNWDVWGERVNKILEDAVEEWRGVKN